VEIPVLESKIQEREGFGAVPAPVRYFSLTQFITAAEFCSHRMRFRSDATYRQPQFVLRCAQDLYPEPQLLLVIYIDHFPLLRRPGIGQFIHRRLLSLAGMRLNSRQGGPVPQMVKRDKSCEAQDGRSTLLMCIREKLLSMS
jgi:hypothetical protein